MSDLRIRSLERQAATGDPGAAARLVRERRRVAPETQTVDRYEGGEWVSHRQERHAGMFRDVLGVFAGAMGGLR